MTSSENQPNYQRKYIEDVLVPKIVSEFQNEEFESVEINCSTGLDGFMSALYTLKLRTKSKQQLSSIKERCIIVKLMKGDEQFREGSKSYIQFANEVFIYDKVLPAYDELLKKANITDICVENWVPHCYVAKFGYIKGLSIQHSSRDSVLALGNLKSEGYNMGPRVYLSREHLFLMAKTLGQYHSMSYALRHHNETLFETLCKQIIPLPFIEAKKADNAKPNLYARLHRISFDRFFEYFERQQNSFDRNNPDDVKFLKKIHHLRDKYFKQPEKLLEHLRTSIAHNEEDRHFSVIVHGDYNRNNVMFCYRSNQNVGKTQQIESVKMFDFQELRYNSPAIDVSFFMFFNTSATLRNEIWMDLIKIYHNEMCKTFEKVLYGLKDLSSEADISETLKQYSFDKFYAHFSRFAFYGVMICVQYLPWLLCSEEECRQLSHGFETDMNGDEFYKISMTAGGDEANKCVMDIVRYASKMGLSAKTSSRECILALENLKVRGFTMGPRLYLNREHLFIMAKTLGQYHSMSYALRKHDEVKFDALRKQIIPLPFIAPPESGNNLYAILYRVAFDRFFEYFERLQKQGIFDENKPDNLKLVENIERMREKYFKQPEALLEHFRTSIDNNEDDRRFGAILHGDFNRNNVMFRYKNVEMEENCDNRIVEDIKLIDFQELRYGTPAIDLSFFMFFNTTTSLRSKIWMDLLKTYHDEMYKSLENVLQGLKGPDAQVDISKTLEQYSFEKFNAHFSRFAFYGVMVCLHFLPWLLCSEEECSQLSHGFETDMNGDEFYKISMTAGGDDANKCILDVIKHASKMGYMDQL